MLTHSSEQLKLKTLAISYIRTNAETLGLSFMAGGSKN